MKLFTHKVCGHLLVITLNEIDVKKCSELWYSLQHDPVVIEEICVSVYVIYAKHCVMLDTYMYDQFMCIYNMFITLGLFVAGIVARYGVRFKFAVLFVYDIC